MTIAVQDIHVDDLGRPVLTAAARHALAHAERNPVELTEEAVLSAARQITGLDDFGPDSFRDGLRRWVAGASGNALFRAEMFRAAVHYAGNRLLLQDLLVRHPEIRRQRITAPIVIVSPPRTGTTFLHGLLAADSRLRAIRYGEVVHPFPPRQPVPAAIRASSWFMSYQHQEDRDTVVLPLVRTDLLPDLGAMHELAPHDVAEELPLLLANFPVGSDDVRSHYEYLKTVLKALQWQHGPDRWILKSPTYCEQLGPLLATFPDATVVFPHRDPVAVVQSQATMFAYMDRLEHPETVDVPAIFEATATRMANMFRARMRDRHVIPAGHAVDVLFHELTADPAATVARVHQAAGLDLPAGQRDRMATFQAESRGQRRRRMTYDLRADFGVTPDELRERFAFYTNEFPVRVEVR